MAWTNTYDTATPAGSDDPAEADDRMREIKLALQERLAQDHYFPLTGTEVSDTAAGEHEKVTLRVASAPTAVADKGFVYAKDVSGKAELFYIDEDGDEIQITSGGILNALNLTGAQTVAGVKTFSSIPKIPTTAPTADAEVAGKKYVDDQFQSSIVTGTNDISETSGNWDDMEDMSITITTTGGNVLLMFTASLYVNALNDDYDLRFDIDGTPVCAQSMINMPAASRIVSMHWLATSLSAASHTFKVQWKDRAGTVHQAGTTQPRVFSAIEVPN